MSCALPENGALASKDVTITLKTPDIVYVDEDYSVRPPRYGTIDLLMQSLKESGPLVAVGKMGPNAYKEAPVNVRDKFGDQNVYGWKPNTSKESSPLTSVILIGAKKTEKRSYVYFTLAKDVTADHSPLIDKKSLIRGYKPSSADSKIYVMSYESFLQRALVNLHPICPHGAWLFSADPNSFLDRGAGQQKCKEIGQRIFDHYKAAKGDSDAAKSAVQRICEAAKFLGKDLRDGVVRKSHIESAWDGIGDRNWTWRA